MMSTTSTTSTEVSIDREALQRLVNSLEMYWSDHRSARTLENVFWAADHAAIERAKLALRAR